MIRALLVDLDDTLLENDLGRFLPAYFDLLADSLAGFDGKERAMAAILAGTKAMLANDDPTRTLAETFYASFQSGTGADPAEVAPLLEHFYSSVYPSLERVTRPKPGVHELLTTAVQRGLRLAVATNPLMIRPAIERRLAWAGASVESFRYALITDVETFHFAKPRPAYVAEALAYLGLLPHEAALVGNDIGEDLEPAAGLGLPVFHVSSEPDSGRPSGDLAQAALWLDATLLGEPEPILSPAAVIARFEGQLAAMLSRLARLDRNDLRTPPSEGRLAPLQIVCHLRDVDREVNLPRLKIFLEQENPFFSSVDTDHWIEERSYLSEDPAAAVAGFVNARREVTAALRGLSPDEWQRRARHSLLGPLRLLDWMGVLVEHDLGHQAQIDLPVATPRPTAKGN